MAEQNVERRLAAVLAADVVGYSRLMAADEERTLARLNSYRREVWEPTIAEHRGRVVKRTGDGMLVEFGSAVDAARCAILTQQGTVKRNEGVPYEKRIDLRISIHVGDVIIEEGESSETASTWPHASKVSRSPGAFRFPRMPGGRCRAR
jgi:adenylate cyclase